MYILVWHCKGTTTFSNSHTHTHTKLASTHTNIEGIGILYAYVPRLHLLTTIAYIYVITYFTSHSHQHVTIASKCVYRLGSRLLIVKCGE